jgi:PAS domain S-box-containing protein
MPASASRHAGVTLSLVSEVLTEAHRLSYALELLPKVIMRNARDKLDLGNLRARAEEELRDRKQSAPASSPVEQQRLLYELEVHQIELEMQNEELREARIDLETALARYTEIFDFAPVGYTTIALDTTLQESNHTAARLLGWKRSELVGQRFDSLVVARDRSRFSELLGAVVQSETRESCELELLRLDGRVVAVRLLASLLAQAEPVILIAVEELDPSSQSAESGVVPGRSRALRR